jgi:hypothetical protein
LLTVVKTQLPLDLKNAIKMGSLGFAVMRPRL